MAEVNEIDATSENVEDAARNIIESTLSEVELVTKDLTEKSSKAEFKSEIVLPPSASKKSKINTTILFNDNDKNADVRAILSEIINDACKETTPTRTATSFGFSTIGEGLGERLWPSLDIENYLAEDQTDSFCGCMFKSTTSSSETEGPTASDVLFDTLVNHQIYDDFDNMSMYGDSIDSTSANLTWDRVGSKIEPFILEKNFGFNLSVAPICLTSRYRHEIFYTCAHKGVIYDYENKRTRFIHGHSNEIQSAVIESSGKYLATSDMGENSSIIITDTTTCETVHTIYNEVPDYGASLVGMSPNGKYLISIHPSDNPVIKLWMWTYGEERPNDIYMYPGKKAYGNPKRISFHPNVQEYVMIAFEKQVLFLTLDTEKQVFSTPVIPKLKKKIGLISDCTLALNCHECFTCTSDGYIQVFGNAIYTENYDEHSVNSNKYFVKSIKVSAHPIVYLQSIDGILVSIDDTGYVQFYDTYVKLMFWIPHHHDQSVTHSMSFSLTPRNYIFDDPFSIQNDIFSIPNPLDYLEMQPEDRVPEYEVLYRNTVPSIASLERHPFIVRCFISSGTDGRIYLKDLVREESREIVGIADSAVASIDCSDERNYLIIAYLNGRLSLYRFDTCELIISSTHIAENRTEPVTLSYVKFSPQVLFFSVATTNGEIWFLNMILEPTPPEPHCITNRHIVKICYSQDSMFCAYYDITNVVYILRYGNAQWNFVGKMRTHYKPIRDMMFVNSTPPKLFTLGEDRFLIEYAIDDSIEELIIKSRQRIEQSALPCCFLYYSSPEDQKYIIVANSQQKYKLIQEDNRMCRTVALGPCHGCYGELPLEKIKFLPQSNDKYLLFMNNCHIGIQKLPIDGNPYKYIGVIGNPNMNDFAVSADGTHVFTCGKNDSSVLMWRINKGAVDILHRLGGTELDPYYCLIEGGLNGWYFKEMRDLFVYMQILHQGDFYQPQTFGEFLDISELPDLLRSCGFYPSESEIEDLLNDIKYRNYEATGVLRQEIKFSEFVKLYVNHKPARGILSDELRFQFKKLIEHTGNPFRSSIVRDMFIDILCQYGEPFSVTSVDKCLATLLRHHTPSGVAGENFNYLPHSIDFEKLKKNILGILNESVYEAMQEKDMEKLENLYK